MSVNQAWKGKRFKTKAYKNYEFLIYYKLKPLEIPKGFLKIELTFGFSSDLFDFDNPIKPFVDILQKKYGFNDRMIKDAHIKIENVKKGEEFIEFEIKKLVEK